jgi:hypothetical protein
LRVEVPVAKECFDPMLSVTHAPGVPEKVAWVYYEMLCWQWPKIERLSDMWVQGFVTMGGDHRKHNHGWNDVLNLPFLWQRCEPLEPYDEREK